MERLSSLLNEAVESGIAEVGTGAPSKRIGRVESRLGVQLPQSYRTFLAEYGSATLDGIEIFGVVTGDSLPCETVDEMTKQMRDAIPGLPTTMVCIAEDGRGGCVCLDTARSTGQNCPVVYFDHELVLEQPEGATPESEPVADSFVEWIRLIIDGEEAPWR